MTAGIYIDNYNDIAIRYLDGTWDVFCHQKKSFVLLNQGTYIDNVTKDWQLISPLDFPDLDIDVSITITIK